MRVLVVEDEPDLRRVIVQALEENGYAVDSAPDGEEGLQKAISWEYDVVLLDIMMPKKNGWEVLRELRKQRKTPVLMLTAKDTIHDRVRGLDGGADDYVVKPFSIAELLARVRALIRRSMGESDAILTIGDVEINTTDRTVWKNGELVPLTAREYGLVEYLAMNRGTLVTRTKIYDHLFGEDDDSLSNLVDVHVSHIRKKLGPDFIETRRGHGYIVHG